MKKFYNSCIRILLLIMTIISVYWFWVSFLNIQYVYKIYFVGFISIFFLIVMFFPTFFKNIIDYLLKNKYVVFIFMILFQFLILLSSKAMIRSDAAYIFNGAIKVFSRETISNYLSYNSNNIFLFLYERFFYNIFGNNCIWFLQIINILLLDCSIWYLYKIVEKYFSKSIANIVFVLFCLLLGFTPQFMAMYSDILIIPIIIIQLKLSLEIINSKKVRYIKKGLLLGLVSAIGMLLRPTSVIIIIALFIIVLFNKKMVQTTKLLVFFLMVFLPIFVGISILEKKSKSIDYVDNIGRNYLSFFDLGLTDNGGNQDDFQNGLSLYADPDSIKKYGYDNRYSKEVLIQDIKRRLNDYNFITFNKHLLLKASDTLKDGTFDWRYIDTPTHYFENPLYANLQKNFLTKFIRKTFINTDNENYEDYRLLLQMVYVIMTIGLVITSFIALKTKKTKIQTDFLLLSIFGGVLFLMIFEGGKSRYLIQFLPQILIISSIGIDALIKSINIKKFKSEEL